MKHQQRQHRPELRPHYQPQAPVFRALQPHGNAINNSNTINNSASYDPSRELLRAIRNQEALQEQQFHQSWPAVSTNTTSTVAVGPIAQPFLAALQLEQQRALVSVPAPPPPPEQQFHQSWPQPQPLLLPPPPPPPQVSQPRSIDRALPTRQAQQDTPATSSAKAATTVDPTIQNSDEKIIKLKREHAAQLQDAKAQLTQQLQDTQTQLHTSQAQLLSLQDELNDITNWQDEEQLERALTFIDELKRARDEAVNHRHVMGEQLRAMKEDKEQLKDSRNDLQEELRQAKHVMRELELTSKNQQIDKTDKDTSQQQQHAAIVELMKEQQQTLRDQNSSLQQSNQALQDQLQDAKRDQQHLQNQHQVLQTTHQNLQEQLQNAKQNLQDSETNRATLQDRNDTVLEQLKAAIEGNHNELLGMLQRENEKLQLAQESLQDTLQQQQHVRANLEKQLQEQQDEFNRLQAQLAQSQQECLQAQQQVQTQKEDAQAQQQKWQDTLERLQTEHAAAVQKAHAMAQSRTKSLQDTTALLQEQLQQGTAKVAQLHVELDRAEADKGEWQRHAQQFERQAQETTAQLQEAQANNKEMTETVDRMEQEQVKQQAAWEAEQADLKAKHLALADEHHQEMVEFETMHSNLMAEKEEALADVKGTVVQLQHDLETHEEEKERLEEHIQLVEREREDLKADLASAKDLVATTDAQLQEALETLGELEAKLVVLTTFSNARQKQQEGKASGKSKTRGLPATEDDLPPPEMDAILLKELAKAKTASAKTKGELRTVVDHNLCELKAVHESMQGGIEEANGEIKALEAGMDDLERLQREFVELEASNSAVEKELADTQEQLQIAKNVVKRLAGDVETMQRDLVGTQFERDDLQDQLGIVTNNLDKTKALVAKQEKKILQLETDLAEANEEIEGLQASNGELSKQTTKELANVKAERNSLEAACDEARAELEGARDEASKMVDKHSKEVTQLKAALSKLENEASMVEESKKKSQALIDEYSLKIEELEAARSKFVSQGDAWVSKEAELMDVIAELQESAAETEKDVQQAYETHRSVLTATEREKDDALQVKDGLQKELNEAQTAVKSLSGRNKDLMEEQLNANQELEKLRWELRAKTKEIDSSKARVSHLENLEGQAHNELSKVRAELVGKKKENSLLKAQASSLEDSESQAKQELKNVRADLIATRDEVDSLREQVSRHRGSHNKTKNELDDVKVELDETKKENQKLKAKAADHEKLHAKHQAQTHEHEKLQAKHQKTRDMIFGSGMGPISRGLAFDDDDEIEKLQQSLNEPQVALESLQDRYKDLSKAHQGLVKASKDTAVALSRQLDERNNELNSLGKKFRNAQKENVTMEDKLRRTEDQKQKMESTLEQVQQKLDDTLREINELRPAQERAMLELEEVGFQRDAAQESLKSAQSLIESTRKRFDTESQAKNDKIEQLTRDLLLAEKAGRDYEGQLGEAKSKLKQAALDKQKLHKAHAAELGPLKHRASHLEARLNSSRKACSELAESKTSLESQLESAEAKLKSLRDALASCKKDARDRDKEIQTTYDEVLDRAQKLEEELPVIMVERETMQKELGLLRGKLKEALSEKTDLQASFKQAESDLSAVTGALAETLRLVSHDDMVDQRDDHPMNLVVDVRTALGDAMYARDRAIESSKAFEDAFNESKALTTKLANIIRDKEEKLSGQQNAFEREKTRLTGELQDLEGVVEQMALENKKLVKQLRSELRQAEEEGLAFNDNLTKANRDKQLLTGENDTLKRSLNDAAATVAKLKDKAENEADKDYAALKAMNETLQKSLDKAMSAMEKMNASENQETQLRERLQNMEKEKQETIAKGERKEQELLDRLQQLEDEKQALRDEAVKLKWFLDEFLAEAKHLVGILKDSLEDDEPESVGNSPGSSPARSVLVRLESIVKHVEAGVHGRRDIPHRKGVQDGRSRQPQPPNTRHKKDSTSMVMQAAGLSSQKSRLESDRAVPMKAQDLDQASYVQQRLAKSAAATAPQMKPAAAKRQNDRLLSQERIVRNMRLYKSAAPPLGQHDQSFSDGIAAPSRGVGMKRPRGPVSSSSMRHPDFHPSAYSRPSRSRSSSPLRGAFRKDGDPARGRAMQSDRISPTHVQDELRSSAFDARGSLNEEKEVGDSRLDRARWGASFA